MTSTHSHLTSHRNICRYGPLLLLAYFCYGLFPGPKPFAYAKWALYPNGKATVSFYAVMITATNRNHTLTKPIPLERLKREFHQDWYPRPAKLVNTFGKLAERRPSSAQFKRTKALLENYLREYEYAEYELVKVQYNVLRDFGLPDVRHYQVVMSLRKTDAQR